MTISITACPKCKTLLLDDTEMCPSCHHVLKQGAAHLAELYTASDAKYDGSKDVACRECHALNRDGLVRCWQCGAFLREEIEQAYQEMKAHPAQAIPVQPIPKLDEIEGSDPGENSAVHDEAGDDLDDDFELADDVNMVEAELLAESETNRATVSDMGSNESEEQDSEEEKDLFELAVTEEKEASGQKKKSPARMSFLVKCPSCSSNIRVQSYRQGKIGQCPKCSLPFMVPILAPPKKAEDKKGKKKGKEEPVSLPEDQIITSVEWHEINEKKFKPKVKALAGKGAKVDIIRREEGLLFAWAEKKGLMGITAAQTEKARSDIARHLLEGKPADQIPATRSELIPVELLQQVRLVWPGTESELAIEQDSENTESENKDGEQPTVDNFTAGIPVFGEYAIVLEIPALPTPPESENENAATAPVHPGLKQNKKKPKKPKKKKVKPPADPLTRCISLTLSQYRRVRQWLEKLTGQPGFLSHAQLPLENVTQQWKCELSGESFDALASPEYYMNDPALDTTTVGWMCQCNEVTISEQARAEQKFGGKKPAGLAKAKCPKCEQKFGNNPLYHLTSIVAPPAEEEKKSPDKKDDSNQKQSNSAQSETPPESQEAATDSNGTGESTEAEKKSKKKFSLKSLFGKKKKETTEKA